MELESIILYYWWWPFITLNNFLNTCTLYTCVCVCVFCKNSCLNYVLLSSQQMHDQFFKKKKLLAAAYIIHVQTYQAASAKFFIFIFLCVNYSLHVPLRVCNLKALFNNVPTVKNLSYIRPTKSHASGVTVKPQASFSRSHARQPFSHSSESHSKKRKEKRQLASL